MVVHTYNCYSALGIEGGRPEVLGHPWLHSKFNTSLGYMKINLVTYPGDNFQNLKITLSHLSLQNQRNLSDVGKSTCEITAWVYILFLPLALSDVQFWDPVPRVHLDPAGRATLLEEVTGFPLSLRVEMNHLQAMGSSDFCFNYFHL